MRVLLEVQQLQSHPFVPHEQVGNGTTPDGKIVRVTRTPADGNMWVQVGNEFFQVGLTQIINAIVRGEVTVAKPEDLKTPKGGNKPPKKNKT